MSRATIPPIRRRQLVDAACIVIARDGMERTTVAAVAGVAGLSAGIVSHYFGSKDGLLEAAMRQVLRDQANAVAAHRRRADSSARAQIRATIDAHLDPCHRDPVTLSRTWLAFWSATGTRPELKRLQRVNDRRLHSNLTAQYLNVMPRECAKLAAWGTAAMISGVWLRGCLGDVGLDTAGATRLIYAYVDQWLSADA